MKIRNRLSLQFTLISALLLLIVLSCVYLLSENYRKNDFRESLTERAITNAQLFLAEDNLSKEKFKEVQKKFVQSLPQEDVHIYDDNYKPVFINETKSGWTKDIIDKVKGEKSYYDYQNGKQTVGIYYVDNSGNFTVLVSAVDTYGMAEMQQLFLVMVVAFFLSVLILFFSGQIFSSIALAPMIKVMNDVKFIRSTSLNKRLQTKASKDEINELAITFNNLLEHLEQSFEAQTSFVAHASHEMRTPVTSIIGNIEVTLSHSRHKEEYKRILEGVLLESEKLKELLDNLFELTQLNVESIEFGEIRFDEFLWQVKDEWMNRVKDSIIELRYDLPSDSSKITIYGNERLLFLAVGNIIKNAIKFSDNRPVFCKLYVSNNCPVISIRDNGIGISNDDILQIFQPFFRGKNTSGYDGMGIGLSLANKIFRLHNATIEINSKLSVGTEFIIRFSN